MIETLFLCALRSIALATIVRLALKIFRLRHPEVQLTAWTFVLAASLLMPVTTRLAAYTFPTAPFATPIIAYVVPLLSDEEQRPAFSAGAPEEGAMREAPTSVVDDAMMAASLVYSGVAGLMLLRVAVGLLLTFRLARAAEPLHQPWTGGWDVRVCRDITAPVTFATTILLPPIYEDWSEAKRMAVLAHEGAHVRRGDFFIQIAATANCAIFWFSPLSWLLRRRLSELAEALSDDAALARLQDRPLYAEILLELSLRARSRLTAAVVAMARPGTVRARIDRVLAGSSAPTAPWPCAPALLVLALAPLAAIVASPLVARTTPSTEADVSRVAGTIRVEAVGASVAPPSSYGGPLPPLNPRPAVVPSEISSANAPVGSSVWRPLATKSPPPVAGLDPLQTKALAPERIERLVATLALPAAGKRGGAKAPAPPSKYARLVRGNLEVSSAEAPPGKPIEARDPHLPALQLAHICFDQKAIGGDPSGQRGFYLCPSPGLPNAQAMRRAPSEWTSTISLAPSAVQEASGAPMVCIDQRLVAGDPSGQHAFFVCAKS
jgi:BlaR1 peptidase M56